MMRASARRLTTDMRVVAARCSFTAQRLRIPLHLSSGSITDCTLASAEVTVEGHDGQRAQGRGMSYLSDLWAWPNSTLDHPARDAAMRGLATRLAADLPRLLDGWGHPVELGFTLHEMLPAFTARLPAPEPMPQLAALVCASSFDAALHDAYGWLHGRSSYDLLGASVLPGDLSRFLGAVGQGITLEGALDLHFRPRVPGCVMISIGDPLYATDVRRPVGDGLPESAEEWIRHGGFAIAKLKVAGQDPRADAAWVAMTARLLRELHAGMGTGKATWVSVDPNEGYADVEQVVAFLRYLQEVDAESYTALRYLEQPIPRVQSTTVDLSPASALKPILADEGITGVADMDELLRAGWSGLALKTSKSHTLCLLLSAWCHLTNHPYSMQDLTNPALAAVQALGLAARLRTMNGIELNSPQFTPAANAEVALAHPGVFAARNGEHDASTVQGRGLGY